MTADLHDFAELDGEWPSLLLGNGASINVDDQHIVDALTSGPRRRIAVSVWARQEPRDIRLLVESLIHRLDDHDVVFFDFGHPSAGGPESSRSQTSTTRFVPAVVRRLGAAALHGRLKGFRAPDRPPAPGHGTALGRPPCAAAEGRATARPVMPGP